MKLFLILTVNFVDLLLGILMIAMFLRALLSLIMMGEENRFTTLLYYITEPFILPIRAVLERLNLFGGLPIDMSFFITTVLIGIVQTVLSSIPM